jgi:hypothetical protein
MGDGPTAHADRPAADLPFSMNQSAVARRTVTHSSFLNIASGHGAMIFLGMAGETSDS